MKITKELEAEIRAMMDDYWGSYFRGDLEHWQSYLVDDYRNIGGTEEEIWNSKQEIVEYTHRVIDQMAGLTELRNMQRQIIPYDGYLMVHEFTDIFIRIEEKWTFYGKFRLSSLIQKIADTWKVLHQHGSYPDSHTEQGEAFAFDTLRKENTQLREAVKRRTVELENKNHELKIEVALERVRSASMAMQGSAELASVARTVFEQLKVLGVDVYRSWIDIFHVTEGYVLTWSTDFEGNFQPNPATFPLDFDETMSDFYRDYKSSSKFIELEAHGDEVREWFDYLYSVSSDPIFKMTSVPDDLYQIWAKHSYGTVATTKLSPITENEKVILNRFAKVFEQAYTRFLDLQKAEAQAREAQIETALERVRSRTMAMQHSDELIEISELMFEQIKNLGIELWSCGFSLWYDDNSYFMGYNTGPDGKMGDPLKIPLTEDVFFTTIRDAKRRGDDFLVFESEGESLEETYSYMDTLPVVGEFMRGIVEAGAELPKYQVTHCGFFSHGHLMFIALEHNPKAIDIFKRFTKVFEQTYTRFLDLQKAEAQAREARIETALEKIRSRTMAMQKGEELQEVAVLLYKELIALGVTNFVSCGYVEVNEDIQRQHTWITAPGGDTMGLFHLPLTGDTTFDARYAAWKKKQPVFHQSVAGQVRSDHLEYAITTFQSKEAEEMVRSQFPDPTVFYCFNFSHGYLHIVGGSLLEKEEENLLARFTKVFEQTYTRFLDLQKAEEQAREAEVDLSLERVRSQVTAMQASSDLFDIVVNMRKEFVSLGYTADYFWHMRWLPDVYEMSMTSEDGNRLGMVINVPKFVHDQIPGLAEWEKGSDPTYVLALNAEEAWDYIDNMNKHGDYEVVDPNAPTREDIEHIGGLTFIIARTTHGEIGYSLPGMVPNPPKDAINTLVRLAGVFDLAYKRFEDLQESEQQARLILEERDRLEAALKELHATQDQLVQQEKLASLGQLTAGIAHEIKNPLNFVNNFSDVSLEMIDEALGELQQIGENEHAAETAAILADIKSNLSKIHEHGSRADGIVKSMLQHSRGGDGKMEPSPLNPIIKEYVNLAFHGMRASKEPFDVDIDLQPDESIGDVPLIAEDFSRVILNLCNNGFDAMREKQGSGHKVQGAGDYQPKLTVRTLQKDQAITIEIEDNGPGIPDDIKDKILQPFFTTKKGTQGTGLGLSITNDIVKAHGGELSVNSTSGSGSTFIITLKL